MLPEEAGQAGQVLSARLPHLLSSHRRLLALRGREPANGANLTLLARCEHNWVARAARECMEVPPTYELRDGCATHTPATPADGQQRAEGSARGWAITVRRLRAGARRGPGSVPRLLAGARRWPPAALGSA